MEGRRVCTQSHCSEGRTSSSGSFGGHVMRPKLLHASEVRKRRDRRGQLRDKIIQGDHGGLRLQTVDFVDFDWEFRKFAHLPCHLCPIFTCPSRNGQTGEQTKSKHRFIPLWSPSTGRAKRAFQIEFSASLINTQF